MSKRLQVLVDEEGLTSGVTLFNYSRELAGQLTLSLFANPGGDLDEMPPAIEAAFARFEAEGIGEDERIGDFGLIGGGAAGWEVDRADLRSARRRTRWWSPPRPTSRRVITG